MSQTHAQNNVFCACALAHLAPRTKKYWRVHWPEEQESESGDGSTSNVVVDVWHGHVQQLADGLVVAGAAVGHCDRVHAGSAQDRVLVADQRVDQRVRLLQPSVHGQRDAHRQTAQDFLVLCLLSVLRMQKNTQNTKLHILYIHFYFKNQSYKTSSC